MLFKDKIKNMRGERTRKEFIAHLYEKYGARIEFSILRKWEGGQSCPRSNYLLELAKIEGVTLEEWVQSIVEQQDLKKKKGIKK